MNLKDVIQKLISSSDIKAANKIDYKKELEEIGTMLLEDIDGNYSKEVLEEYVRAYNGKIKAILKGSFPTPYARLICLCDYIEQGLSSLKKLYKAGDNKIIANQINSLCDCTRAFNDLSRELIKEHVKSEPVNTIPIWECDECPAADQTLNNWADDFAKTIHEARMALHNNDISKLYLCYENINVIRINALSLQVQLNKVSRKFPW